MFADDTNLFYFHKYINQLFKKDDLSIRFETANNQIERKKVIKFLDVTLDENVNWQ